MRDSRPDYPPEFDGYYEPGPDTAWVTLCRRTNDPKLAALEQMLLAEGIHSKREGESWHAPILMVPAEDEEAAWHVLDRIDDVPDDDPGWLARAEGVER